MAILSLFAYLLFAVCQSPAPTNNGYKIPINNIYMENKDSSITSLRLHYVRQEHSKDSYTIIEEYTLRGGMLSISKESTGRRRKPLTKTEKAVSADFLQTLYLKAQSLDLLKNEERMLEMPKDASSVQMRLNITLSNGASYSSYIYGDYNEVNEDGHFKNMQRLQMLLGAQE